MNVFIFTGHLGRDAEQRHTSAGDSIVSFSVPVDSGYGAKKKTAWIRCTMFGKRGESVLQYLKKGTQVGISGEFSMNDWTNKEGVAKSSPEVRVADLTLLGGRNNGESPADYAPAQQPQNAGGGGFDDFSSDVPF